VLRNIPQPVNTGRFETNIGINPPGNRLVDDYTLLLLQQRDEPLLSGNKIVDQTGFVVKEISDSGLFG